MGGCPAGDVASQLSVNVLVDELARIPRIGSKREALRDLNRAFQSANSRVVQFGRAHDCAGLGAAVVAAVCREHCICIAGVGDCRGYLFRASKLQQLTTDDTLASSLFKTGIVTDEQINRHAFKNILARCIGSDPFQPADEVCIVDLIAGDRLVLCSDGLFKTLSSGEIEKAVATSDTAIEAARRLKKFAKAASSRDDTTCIVIFAENEDTLVVRHDEAWVPHAIPQVGTHDYAVVCFAISILCLFRRSWIKRLAMKSTWHSLWKVVTICRTIFLARSGLVRANWLA